MRLLHLLEHHSKDMLREYGACLQPAVLIGRHEAALEEHVIVEKMGKAMQNSSLADDALLDGRVLVKAQVLAGARGKGNFLPQEQPAAETITASEPSFVMNNQSLINEMSGVVMVSGPDNLLKAAKIARCMIGKRLWTPQTGPEGVTVPSALVLAAMPLEKSFYLGVLLDASLSGPAIVVSSEGGSDIEDVHFSRIKKVLIEDIECGPSDAQLEELAIFLMHGQSTQSQKTREGIIAHIRAAWSLFKEKDALLVEINPLGVTASNNVVAIDAKVSLDPNALHRQHKVVSETLGFMADLHCDGGIEESGFVAFGDGEIGCMVNGAGLAMATSDVLVQYGSRPANFLDIGAAGGGSPDQVSKALHRVLVRNSGQAPLRAVLVNIFGGIVRCDNVARGLIDGARQFAASHGHCPVPPLVIRMVGTNEDLARDILARDYPGIFSMHSGLDDAARVAADYARNTNRANHAF